jgi:hypothetical protein
MEQRPNISEEIKKIADEPLLPIEKKLIVWSLAIGIVLMAVLIFLSRAYFSM